jgi:hypothetical protein
MEVLQKIKNRTIIRCSYTTPGNIPNGVLSQHRIEIPANLFLSQHYSK